jgi:NAD(P)-dependent dehydrogenase (short-subunit alcohol dehydrogenase family)
MPERAALITGGSSGIGFAIARMLGKDLGYALTVNGLLATSPACFVPEIQFIRAGDAM